VERKQLIVGVGGGDYFLTLVSLMGFTGALTAMFEEPDDVIELLDYISKFYMLVFEKEFEYLKPDVFGLMDDDSAYHAPFFSLDMYRRLFKPFHKIHCDYAIERGAKVERHDCGRSEQFVDDWIELGIRGWNPIQDTNDCKGIKKKYLGRMCLSGCWDSHVPQETDQELKDALAEYTDTFAPGGGFVFAAMPNGSMAQTPEAQHRMEIVQNFYNDYVRDYYKHH